MGQRICHSILVFIALIGFLTSELPITAEKSTLWILDAQFPLCQRLAIHLFLGCKPRLHSTLPHMSYKDNIVSSCATAQSWILQKCCLIFRWFEASSFKRKTTEVMSQFKLFWEVTFGVVVITKPCQIALCSTRYCFQYCLHSSTHKQHDLVYHSRFTCSRRWWSFHCKLHMTISIYNWVINKPVWRKWYEVLIIFYICSLIC